MPGHASIRGNTKADAAAQAALNKDVTLMNLPYTDFKQGINLYVRELWHLTWDVQFDNQLYSLSPRVGTNILPRLTCRDEAVLTQQLRVGHTFLTHCFCFTEINTSTRVCTMSVSIDREALTLRYHLYSDKSQRGV